MEKGDFSSVDNKDSNAVDNANKHYDEDKKNEEYNLPNSDVDDNKPAPNPDTKDNTEATKSLTDILKEIAGFCFHIILKMNIQKLVIIKHYICMYQILKSMVLNQVMKMMIGLD